MRADARRNRDALIEAARSVFREQGYDASLDEIAKRAGVGPGTLYRHFPNREALMDGVLQAWVDRVQIATEKSLAFEGDPHTLLRSWFGTYVDLLCYSKGTAAKITSAMGDTGSPIATKCRTLSDASDRVLGEVRARGGRLRDDVDGLQVARLVGGVATTADNADLAADQVGPLLDIITDGMLLDS